MQRLRLEPVYAELVFGLSLKEDDFVQDFCIKPLGGYPLQLRCIEL